MMQTLEASGRQSVEAEGAVSRGMHLRMLPAWTLA